MEFKGRRGVDAKPSAESKEASAQPVTLPACGKQTRSTILPKRKLKEKKREEEEEEDTDREKKSQYSSFPSQSRQVSGASLSLWCIDNRRRKLRNASQETTKTE